MFPCCCVHNFTVNCTVFIVHNVGRHINGSIEMSVFRTGQVRSGGCLKKNQSIPRPSDHPPVMGEKMSKRLGGIKGCKYKTSSWAFKQVLRKIRAHLDLLSIPRLWGKNVKTFRWEQGSPMQIHYNVGEKPTAILYIYINRHAKTPEKH